MFACDSLLDRVVAHCDVCLCLDRFVLAVLPVRPVAQNYAPVCVSICRRPSAVPDPHMQGVSPLAIFGWTWWNGTEGVISWRGKKLSTQGATYTFDF